MSLYLARFRTPLASLGSLFNNRSPLSQEKVRDLRGPGAHCSVCLACPENGITCIPYNCVLAQEREEFYNCPFMFSGSWGPMKRFKDTLPPRPVSFQSCFGVVSSTWVNHVLQKSTLSFRWCIENSQTVERLSETTSSKPKLWPDLHLVLCSCFGRLPLIMYSDATFKAWKLPWY